MKYCKRVFTMNKNDVFLDKVQMRNTSNCLYVCRTLDYVAKHRTGFSPPTLDEPPSWHSHYITPRALPLPYCRLASGLSSVPSFRFYSSSDSLVWILCLDSRLFSCSVFVDRLWQWLFVFRPHRRVCRRATLEQWETHPRSSG